MKNFKTWCAATSVAMAATLVAVGVASSTASVAAPTARLAPIDTSQHLNIMPLGDSITVGVGDPSSDSYRWELARYLVEVQQVYTANYVGSQSSGTHGNTRHEGHSGWRLDQLGASASGWMATYNPDVVLLHAGVNDARQGASAQQMADRMTALLSTLLASSPTRRVVVGDVILPRYGTNNDQASVAVQQFNGMLPGLVATAGPRVSLARMTAAVPNNLLGDGLHPDVNGYRRMSWVWWRCMAPLLVVDGVTRIGMDPMPVPVPDAVLCPR